GRGRRKVAWIPAPHLRMVWICLDAARRANWRPRPGPRNWNRRPSPEGTRPKKPKSVGPGENRNLHFREKTTSGLHLDFRIPTTRKSAYPADLSARSSSHMLA